MQTIAEEEKEEEEIARSVLGSRPLPGGIHDYRIEFGDDYEGDPAMWIWLETEDVPHPSEWIDRVLEFTQVSRDELLARNLKYRPFFRLSVGKRPH
jgi:hypothetical protein